MRAALVLGALSLLALSLLLVAVASPIGSHLPNVPSSISRALDCSLARRLSQAVCHAMCEAGTRAVSAAGRAAHLTLGPLAELLVRSLDELRACLLLESSCKWWTGGTSARSSAELK